MTLLRDMKQGQEFTFCGKRYVQCELKELVGGPWAQYADQPPPGMILCFRLGPYKKKPMCLLRGIDKVEGTANGGKSGSNPEGA